MQQLSHISRAGPNAAPPDVASVIHGPNAPDAHQSGERPDTNAPNPRYGGDKHDTNAPDPRYGGDGRDTVAGFNPLISRTLLSCAASLDLPHATLQNASSGLTLPFSLPLPLPFYLPLTLTLTLTLPFPRPLSLRMDAGSTGRTAAVLVVTRAPRTARAAGGITV